MTSHLQARQLLNQIASKEQANDNDITVLREIVHRYFPENSPTAGALRSASRKQEVERRAYPQIAQSAALLIEALELPDKPDWKAFEERAVQIVNKTFYESELFKFAKWMLIVAIVAIGGGTATYAGLSLNFWSQAQVAKKGLDDIRTEYERVASEVKKSTDKLQQLQSEATSSIETAQKLALQSVQKLVDEKAVASTEQISSQVKEIRQRLDTGAEQAAASFDKEQKRFVADADAAKARFSNAEVAAIRDVGDGTAAFRQALKDNLSKADDQLAAGVKEKLGIVSDAAVKGADGVERHAKRLLEAADTLSKDRTENLQRAFDGKTRELDQAFSAESTRRLAELSSRSATAGSAIDGVLNVLSMREKTFTSEMSARLATWDRRAELEWARVEDQKKKTDALDVRLMGMESQLGDITRSSKVAIDLVQEIKSGTRTGQLAWIGAVLESSAFLFMFNLGVGALAISIAIGAIVTAVLARRRQPQAGELPGVVA